MTLISWFRDSDVSYFEERVWAGGNTRFEYFKNFAKVRPPTPLLPPCKPHVTPFRPPCVRPETLRIKSEGRSPGRVQVESLQPPVTPCDPPVTPLRPSCDLPATLL